MLKRSTALSAALFWALAGSALPAVAQGSDAKPAPETGAGEAVRLTETAAESVVMVTEFIKIRVEGADLEVRARGLGTEAFEIDAKPIFEKLRSKFEARDGILGYWRFQDGAVMGLDFADGKLRANGVVLGKIPDFPVREKADTWLSPNAIAVLTGTKAKLDPAAGWSFDLDERLKPQFDLDLWVNGAPVSTVAGFEPRTVGPVLLVPLKPVAEALGHQLRENAAAGTVEVIRAHDSAVIKLELATGLVTVNGVASGVTPNIAFAEKNGLILPFSAIETLTGSHIRLTPGSSRVDVTLDDRLASLALPGERVSDAAENTPFTPERLTYQLSDRGPIKLDFYSHFQNYNTIATLETAGGFDTADGLSPRWMSVDIAAMSGWRGTVGDYAGTFREFSGTSTSRIRGISYRTRLDNGTIRAIAAGVPLSGSKPLENGASTPEFSGFAAGVRYIPADGRSEFGVAAEAAGEGDASRIVASGRRTLILPSKDALGFESAYVSGDAGVFQQNGETRIDVRGQAEARYRISQQSSLSATLTYDGAGFQNAGNTQNSNTNFGERASASVAADWHALKSLGAITHAAAGVRTAITHTGGALGSTSFAAQAAFSGRIGETGPDLALDLSRTETDSREGKTSSDAITLRGWHNFEWGQVNATYASIGKAEGEREQRFAMNTTLPIWKRSFNKGATASIAPSASLAWSPDATDIRAGVTVNANSGQWLGDKLNLNGQFALLTRSEAEGQASDKYANAQARWRLNDWALVQAQFSTDFADRNDFSIGVSGALNFNEARRHLAPIEGTGVLKGRVFFDRNRDGLRQEDEPGIPGARISLMGTRLALAADNTGHYTIQNLKTGLYTMRLDRRSLPLGLLIAEEDEPRATIGEGRITTLDIPVIESGQIRGAVFADANGNSIADPGETRLEGQWIKLVPVTADKDTDSESRQAAAFGQFGFENLAPGDYRLETRIEGRLIAKDVSLTDENLMLVVDFAVPAESLAALAAEKTGLTAQP